MTVTVTAKKWAGGWELWSGDECWTQVANLESAVQQVRDYLDTVEPSIDHARCEVVVVPDFTHW